VSPVEYVPLEKASKPWKICVSFPHMKDAYWLGVDYGVVEEAKRLGFIGVCDTTDGRLPTCEKWMKENAPDAEQVVMTTQRFFKGHAGPSIAWKVYIEPPGK